METLVTPLLWILAAVVYLNIGWLVGAWFEEKIKGPDWWETFADGPAAWTEEDKTKQEVSKIIFILLGPATLIVGVVFMIFVWACYFTFGGGVARHLLKDKLDS
jgi:hypothetical protein